MNMTSLGELAKGQYLIKPSSRNKPSDGSFARNSIEHRMRCQWNKWLVWTLCSGIMTLLKKTMCYYLKGTANPEIILARMSSNYEAPLNLKVQWIKLQKQSLIAFLIIFLLGTSFAYSLCRMFFRYYLSLGYYESNSYKNS